MPRPATLYTGFALGAGVLFAVFEFFYLRSGHFPYDGLNYVVGWDFVNSWMGGRAALHGDLQTYFEVHRYNAQIHRLFAPDLPFHNWSYPPHILLLLWPFGLFPYLASYALWLVAGLGVYLWAASNGKFDRELLLFLALSPVAMVLVLTGQNGFFTGALLLGVLAQWDKRPVLAGIMLGLLSVKPQLVLLMPLVLMMTGRWRCLAVAAATAAAMMALTTVLYGPAVWTGYLADAVPFQNIVMTKGTGLMLGMMPTAFINARLMGAPDAVAWALQAVTAIIALAAVVWTFRKRRDPMLSNAMLLAASLLVTPYSFNYDMAALIAVLAQMRLRPGNSRIDTALILTVWMLPVVMMLGFFVKLAGSALVLLALMNRLFERLRQVDAVPSVVRGVAALGRG
jgi:alpha-1,2-mannosyltransferase